MRVSGTGTGRGQRRSGAGLAGALLALAGCSDSSPSDAGGAGRAGSNAGHAGTAGTVAATLAGHGTIAGSIRGSAFTTVATALWIGKPDTGAPPTQVYLSDAPLDCAALSSAGWDKTLGSRQLLEMDLNGDAPATFTTGKDADANYSGGAYNPTADDGGTIAVSTINLGTNIVGSFDLMFAGEQLKGSFDASFCAEGVEP